MPHGPDNTAMDLYDAFKALVEDARAIRHMASPHLTGLHGVGITNVIRLDAGSNVWPAIQLHGNAAGSMSADLWLQCHETRLVARVKPCARSEEGLRLHVLKLDARQHLTSSLHPALLHGAEFSLVVVTDGCVE